MLSDGLHPYEFLNEQLLKVKALRHLVKQHDLQVRDCINHSDSKLLDIFKQLDFFSDTVQITKVEEETQKIIETLEADVDKTCSEVEKSRLDLEAESQNVIQTITSKLQKIVKAFCVLHNLNSEMENIVQVQQQQEMEKSKEAFSTDDTFKALLEEKHTLASEEAAIRLQIKELDNTEISEMQELSKTLKNEKSQLVPIKEHELHTVCAEQHASLAQSQHLDEVAAELLEEFMNSTAPLGGVSQVSPQTILNMQNASQEFNVWNVMSKEPYALLTNLFEADVRTLFKDYKFTETELSIVQTVIEQSEKEKVISDVATFLAGLNEKQENNDRLHPYLQKVLLSHPPGYKLGDNNIDSHDFPSIVKERPQTPTETPVEEAVPAESQKTVSDIQEIKPTAKKLPPHLNLLQF